MRRPTSGAALTARRVAIATVALIASLVVGVPGAAASDATTYNPWGFQNGQTLTEAEASAIVLHQINLQRSLIGLSPLSMSADRSGALCSVAKLQQGSFRHYGECIPSNHYENIYASYSTGAAVPSAAKAWTTSTSGHNEAMYSTTMTHAQVAVSCGPKTVNGRFFRSAANVAFQPVNANGPSSARSSRANVNVLQDTNALYAATGVTCDGSTLRFRLHPDLRVSAPYLVPGERAIDLAQPQVWHRFQVARLYSAYFDRAPDAGGWAYWNARSVNGMTTWRTSDFFADSPEFKATYGASLSNAEFLELVYQNVLGRSPDAGGLQYWNQRMASGTTRGQVMVHFSESIEYIEQMAPTLTGACWNGNVAASYLCAAPNTARPNG